MRDQRDLEAYLEGWRKKIDSFLESRFRITDSKFEKLFEAVRYSLLGGGKRIRPILAIAAFEACSLHRPSTGFIPIIRVGSAIEMIHTYSLIHDDLPAMDNDDLRRGRATNHKVFGEAMAILAGDALLTEAFTVIAQIEEIAPSVLLQIMGDIAEASGGHGMAGGQVLDLQAEGQKISPEMLEELHRHKTGYLIRVSVTSGAKLAGASEIPLKVMQDYGEKVGLAFQIADDILDVEGGVQEMGKQTGGDARKEKATYPSIFGLERSKQLANELIQKAVEVLQPFDHRADPLREMARYIVARRG